MNGPASAASSSKQQRHAPPRPLPLRERTTSHNVAHDRPFLAGADASPPSTPKNPRRRADQGPGNSSKTGSGAGEKGKGPVVRAQKENVNVVEQNRHSHGLSWNSTTRDSVVDNLLLSLDNLATHHVGGIGMTGAHGEDFDSSRYRSAAPEPPQFQNPRPQRPRGHTYSSSLSSDYDRHGMSELSPSSTYSGHLSQQKGRRSNSSSNFSTLPSARNRPVRAAGRSSSETQKHVRSAIGIGAETRHGREGSDNFDYGYNAVSEARRLAFNGRSVSMDNIYNKGSTARSNSILGRGRPVPSVHSKYEAFADPAACPEPGVPAGPRKLLNPQASGPVYVGQAPKSSALRKTTTQSDLRSSSTPNPAIPREIMDQASDFVRASSMRGDPQVPSSTSSQRQVSAQSSSPSVLRRKDTSSPQRERPGFFKRVFGGGSSRTQSGLFDHADLPGGALRMKSPLGGDNNASQRSVPRQTPKDGNTNVTPQTLNKKPSSFFRRRKKSNTDAVALPPGVPVPAQLKYTVPPAEESPSVSSLRKVLDPYLSPDGKPANTAKLTDDDEYRPSTKESTGTESDLELFHTGYTPPPDATLGRRDPFSREISQAQREKQNERMRVKVRKRLSAQNIVSQVIDRSFLHDPSRNPSQATLEQFKTPESEVVSPISEDMPVSDSAAQEQRPVSRASTGDRIIAMKDFDLNQNFGTVRRVKPSEQEAVTDDDEEWGIRAPPHSAGKDSSKSSRSRSNRLFLQPSTSEDRLDGPPKIRVNKEDERAASVEPFRSRQGSFDSPQQPSTQYHSASSLPLMQVNSANIRESVEFGNIKSPGSIEEGAEHRERARKIYEGDEEDVLKNEAASWLGERNPLSTRTLEAYMQLYDFSGQNILSALRTLCGRLILRGETQQFDRIVTALSSRWCECNPSHGFKAQDVVHTICYSLILLNTDLHLADIGDKMSRTAYVKNTLPTIKRVLADAAPEAFKEDSRAARKDSRPSAQHLDSSPSVPSSPAFPPASSPNERTSFELPRPQTNKRLSLRPGMLRTESDGWTPDGSASNALVSSSNDGNVRNWEFEIETMLKSFFGSIRTDPLPLFGAAIPETTPSQNNLSAGNFGLKRSGSVVSKAPSDNASYRSKGDFRTMTMRWQGRNNRSRPKVYPSSTVASSRTSLDDGNSVWSPAQSSTWSKYSFGKTLTSSSLGSLGQHLSPTSGDFKHSIGFANALSQAIIREEGTTTASTADTDSFGMTSAGTLDDESLALEGAPWAKEGLVKHKHHHESLNHKAKERSWNDCFAVIGKGKLTLFNFNTSSKGHSMSRKNNGTARGNDSKSGRAASSTSTHVGGGDWMENAEQLLSLSLLQTIASTLPPPGYSKTRPFVWALSLPTGAVHLFQVGTMEIAREFVTTANYWSARLSKEPLSGGVSNIEYGWSEAVVDPALLPDPIASSTSPPSSMQTQQLGHMHSASASSVPGPGAGRSSMQSSIRTSFEAQFGSDRRVRLPGDKVQIQEWTQPSQSMMASQLMEVDQLKALQTYVEGVEEELARHNELKDGIELAFSLRHSNRSKALNNWQRKSDYLLREIVKFRTYIDSLIAAQKARDDFEARLNPENAALLAAPSSAGNDGNNNDARDITPRADQVVGMFAPVHAAHDRDEDGNGDRDTTPRASRVPPAVQEG